MAREILHTAAGEIAREGGAPEEMERGWVRDEPEVSQGRREGGGESGVGKRSASRPQCDESQC